MSHRPIRPRPSQVPSKRRRATRVGVERLDSRLLPAVDYTLQILHAGDFEAGLAALQDAPNFAAVVQALEDDFANTVILASGDNYIPGPFFNAGGDPALNAVLGGDGTASVGRADIEVLNRIGVQASALGNHEFDAGPREVRNIIRPAGGWRGAQFPYLAANLAINPADADLGAAAAAGGQEASAVRGRIAPSAVITVNGERIGVVGVITPELPNISSPGPGVVVSPANPADLPGLAAAVQPTIDALTAAGIDKIIVTTQLQQIANDRALAPLLRGVDVILSGGSNTRLSDANDRLRPGDASEGPYPILAADADGHPVAIVSTDGNYRYVGRLVVGFDADGVIDPAGFDPAASGAYATDEAGVAALWDNDLAAAFATGTKGAAVREVTLAVGGVITTKDAERFGRTDVYLNGLRGDVRTQETNLGNITADANLRAAKAIDPTVTVSLKNGGGIRDSIGSIDPETFARRPPVANPAAGKSAGDVSRLDVENSLRFDNQLSLISVSARDFRRILEHAVAATAPGATPGQFPQVGGLSFSFDPGATPIAFQPGAGGGPATLLREGRRIRNASILDEAGNVLDAVVRDGEVVGDPDRMIRIVTLNFLANDAGNGLGGDSYPFPLFGSDRVDLGIGEQSAFIDYIAAEYPLGGTPFRVPDVGPVQDLRIQNLALRGDAVPGAPVRFQAIGSIAAGAEIAAYDPQSRRVFVTSGASVEILSIADPTRPVRVGVVDLSAFGGTVSSVAVNGGLVAAAVIAADKVSPGRVVFMDAGGALRGSVVVGAQPDMLTFTPDGARVLVANEGEAANIADQAANNPEGSVAVITLDRANLSGSAVQIAGFGGFNAQRAALIAEGVRIFATSATVAQDLEPEYIAVAPGGATAFVTLQEANAFAVLDIASATITDIVPLGLKDFGGDLASLETYTLTDRPTLGTTAAGDAIPLGGFSGLVYEGVNPANGNLRFLTHTDRGPNAEPVNLDADPALERPFPLPDFQPELIRLELDRSTGRLAITQRIGLTRQDGTPLTGRSNLRVDPGDNAPFNDEEPVDLLGNPLAFDPLGADLEGIAPAGDGTFWAVDEYRPALYHFDAAGRLIERVVPQGTAAAAGQPLGTFGTEDLPAVLGQRRANRGFEGVAIFGGRVYAFVQSTIRNPASLSNGALNGLRNIRVVEYNPANGQTRQFLYVQDAGSDKIGDAASLGNGEFLVVERDDDSIFTPNSPAIDKKVYRFSLAGATDVSALTGPINGKTIDQMTPAELAAAGVVPINKALYVDLAAAGYNRVEKVEGLAIIDANTIAVINDDDFGLEGTFNVATGRLTPNPSPEPIVLGIVHLQSNGLDPSDQDGGINIGPQPVSGLFMPDGIASYQANGQTYYITANEGDTREEERRIGAGSFPTLDPTAYPDAASLRQNANLGRLNASPFDGDADGDGDIDRLTVYGGRSFSIWDASGRLVYDSGDLLEQLTALLTPDLFNANDGLADRFDTRSDDKGPEPEGVATGTIGGRTYAFIALERGPGGLAIFDVTNPARPEFVQFANRAGDVSPEGITFISAADSPNGRPMVLVANELSNTVTIYQALDATAGDDRPGAAGDAFAATEDTPLVVGAGAGVLANDVDPEGTALSAVLVSGPANGSLTLGADGSFTYTPDADFSGNDSFTYRPRDAGGVGEAATVTIAVAAVDDPPAGQADAYATDEDAALNVPGPGVLANDADPDGGPAATVVLDASVTTIGTVVLNPDGSFTYTPRADFSGTDTFAYRVAGRPASEPATAVTITVRPVNDAPRAAEPVPVAATAGVPLVDVPVARFLDVDPTSQLSGYLAVIDWGDGSPATAGRIAPAGNGGFHVLGSHAYARAGSFPITVTLADPGGGTASSSTTATVAPSTQQLTVRLDAASDTGASAADRITNDATPTLRGTAPAGYLIDVIAGSAVVGRTVAGPDGTFSVTTDRLRDGAYSLRLSAAAPTAPGVPALTTTLDRLVVDTVAPRVSALRLDPRTGRVLVTFVDAGAGLTRAGLSGAAAYAVTRTSGRPRTVPISVLSVGGGSGLAAGRTVSLRLLGVRNIRSGRFVIGLASGALRDAAGNALDGEFTGAFPTGNGRPGGNLRASLNVNAGRVSTARPVQVAAAEGPGEVPRGPLAGPRRLARRR